MGYTYTSVKDSTLKIVKGGTVSGNNLAATTVQWPGSDQVASYGGSQNVADSSLGVSLTPANVNATDFGVVLSVLNAGGTAKVDRITMTVYYTVPGIQDLASFVSVLRVDQARTVARPEIYALPRGGLTIANDPNVDKATNDAILYSSRYYAPSRNVEKIYRAYEFWLEIAPETNTPGFQVWASVDDGDAIQLLDEDGNAATFYESGPCRAVFPATAASIGHYVQIQWRVPAASVGQNDVAVSFYEGAFYVELRPLTTQLVDTVFILGKGESEDRTSGRRSVAEQLASLEALTGRNSVPTPYRDNRGRTGFMVLTGMDVREVTFKGEEESTLVAIVQARVTTYA